MTTVVNNRTSAGRKAVPQWAADLGVARIEDYFGPWAFEEHRFAQIVDTARSMDLARHVGEARNDSDYRPPTAAEIVRASTRDGVCVIDLNGSLMKYVGSMTRGTSTVHARRLLRAARNSESVQGVLLRIDSPGGTAAGTADLAAEIEALTAKKPVVAFIEDLAASAAYWAASAAEQVMATATSLVGCIGTYSVIRDFTAQAAMEGVKVHVIRAGAMKGAGVPGTEITNEILGEAQRIVNGLNAHFLAGVAKGRRLPADRVAELADGRVWLAAEAKEKGLIDAIGSFDQAVASVLTLVEKQGGNRRKETRMSHENDEGGVAPPPAPKAATFAELKQAFPKADAAFRESCMERNLTLQQASAAWTEKLEADLEASRKEAEKAKADAAAMQPRPGGAKPIVSGKSGPAGAEAYGTAVERFEARVESLMDGGKRTKEAAIRKIVAEEPELHSAYVAERNEARGLAKAAK